MAYTVHDGGMPSFLVSNGIECYGERDEQEMTEFACKCMFIYFLFYFYQFDPSLKVIYHTSFVTKMT